MDLLPKSHTEFDSPEYWDKFFKRLGSKTFEWYGEYPQLCGVIHKYVKPKDKLLVVGCGNSQLSADMYDIGITNMVNIDVSDIVIRQMKDKNSSRDKMSFVKMDVTEMPYEAGEFSVVLDKGTLDALMVNTETDTVTTVIKMFCEIQRVLKLGGRYICFSLLQDHILRKLVQHFSDSGWPIRIHRIITDNTSNDEFQLPVFAVVCTKFKKMEGMKQILEISGFEDKIERVDMGDNLIKLVKEMQYYGMLRQEVANNEVSDHQPSFSLYNDLIKDPRYTLYIVDNSKHCVQKFAIFIAPEGRETEWLFSSETGRRQLASSAGFQRLVVVTLDRNHTYTDLKSIQDELSAKVMELAPPSYKSGVKVPFLSMGTDIGKRTVRKRFKSEINGEYLVEDVVGDDGQIFRRLIFMTNQGLIQSEARLMTGDDKIRKKKGKTKSDEFIIDKSYLSCSHHQTMITAFGFSPKLHTEEKISCLIIGLGGGALSLFIHQYIPNVDIEVVDIDQTVVNIAKEWFGFKHGPGLKVHVADGIHFIKDAVTKGRKYDVILFDIDQKDCSIGLSCPAAVFLEESCLKNVCQILTESGVFVLNLVCRNEELKIKSIQQVKDIFTSFYSCVVDDEVNVILFGQIKKQEEQILQTVRKNVRSLNDSLKKSVRKADVNLIETMSNLQFG